MGQILPKEMDSIQQRYCARIQNSICEWEAFEAAFLARGASRETFEQFHRSSHNFARSGMIFGYPQISHTGKNVQCALEHYMTSPEAYFDETATAIAAFLRSLREAEV